MPILARTWNHSIIRLIVVNDDDQKPTSATINVVGTGVLYARLLSFILVPRATNVDPMHHFTASRIELRFC